MPADDGLGPHDGNRMDHFAEHANGQGEQADVRDSCVLRVPDAYPACFGSYVKFDEIRRWATGIPNLFCVGRNGMHRYNNQDDSMLTAMMAVDNIAAGCEDDSAIWDVNMEMVYGEG
jgi:protoporphyrinogen oxidase